MFPVCSPKRRGMTLPELMIASALMVLIAGGLSVLATALHGGANYTDQRADLTQHARVIHERIRRDISQAHANEHFPGCLAFEDTLAVWRGPASSPQGRPLWSELVVYCPDPDNPSSLLEITASDAHVAVPERNDTAAWLSDLNDLKNGDAVRKVELTSWLRSTEVAGNARGAIRFHAVSQPSSEDWARYRQGEIAWDALTAPQGLRGLAKTYCRWEVQLVGPREPWATPFFGASSVHYGLTP